MTTAGSDCVPSRSGAGLLRCPLAPPETTSTAFGPVGVRCGNQAAVWLACSSD